MPIVSVIFVVFHSVLFLFPFFRYLNPLLFQLKNTLSNRGPGHPSLNHHSQLVSAVWLFTPEAPTPPAVTNNAQPTSPPACRDFLWSVARADPINVAAFHILSFCQCLTIGMCFCDLMAGAVEMESYGYDFAVCSQMGSAWEALFDVALKILFLIILTKRLFSFAEYKYQQQ